MSVFDTIANHSSSGGVAGAAIRLVLRLFQFILALTVAGLYGVDLQHGDQADVKPDGKWVYAEVVAAMSAITCLIYGIPFFKSYWAFGWDWVLFILWTALFGLFGE